jgi:Big-like domain-containing protein
VTQFLITPDATSLNEPDALSSFWGLDVAWGEIWVTTRGSVGYGSTSTGKILTQQIYVLDYQTGLLKDVMWHPVGTPFLSASYSAGNNVETVGEWEDIAVVPERHAVYAGHRAIERGVLPASIPVSEPAGRCDGCSPAMGRQEGTDAPWGMRWLLMANQMGGRANSPAPDEVKIDEFSVDTDAAGHPYLTKRRTWRPNQGAVGDCCLGLDVAYLNREVRVDAWGPMSKDAWINGTQSINYVVSDADIFVVGDYGERWYEQARNFSRIELKIDGVLRASSTSASGAFSFNTNTLSSGTHTLTLTAYLLDGRTASYTNPSLRIDHDAPTGGLTALAPYVSGTVAVEGTMSDAHAGGRDWQLEVQRIGGSWQTVCTDTAADPAINRWTCNWNTASYADGRYNLRARQRDTVDSQTTNTSYTAEVQTVVDNTNPTLSVSGGLRDRGSAGLPIFEDERPPIDAASTDTGGSGVARIEVFVDGLKVDGAEQACEGCSFNRTFSFDPTRHETGDHTVRIVATDQAGRTRETSWTTEIWRNPPDTADESDADQLDPEGADTAGASTSSAAPALGVIPGAANVTRPDVVQTQEGSAIDQIPDLECAPDDPYIVLDHLDYPSPVSLDLIVGAPNPDLAVAGYLNSAANLPSIPPGIFREEITTDLERFYSVHIDGDRRAWILLARTETGGWRGNYFGACSEFVDGYLWASNPITEVIP